MHTALVILGIALVELVTLVVLLRVARPWLADVFSSSDGSPSFTKLVIAWAMLMQTGVIFAKAFHVEVILSELLLSLCVAGAFGRDGLNRWFDKATLAFQSTREVKETHTVTEETHRQILERRDPAAGFEVNP